MQTPLEAAIKKFPASVQEQIQTGLLEAGIVELRRLEIIIPVLSKAIQISKPLGSVSGDGEFNITLIDSRDGKVLVRESDEKKYTIADFINTFNFESHLADGRPTISRDEARHPAGDDLEEIAEGNLKVLPYQKKKPGKKAIPASVIEQGRRKGSPSTEDIASGKVEVDMDS